MAKDLQGKKLLILGGTTFSCEIVKCAQQMGIYTVVADYYEPCNSPAKQIADQSFLVSVIDVDAVVDLIKKENIDGVIVGFNDMLLPYYAEICKKAGLPCYATKEQFEVFIDKQKYKNLCRQYDVPTVKEYHASFDELKNDKIDIDYPVLVKPVDSSGSRGISICSNKNELISAYEKALSFSATKNVLIEQYLTGKEVTVFLVLQDGECYLSGIGNRHMKASKDGVLPLPVGYTFPSIHTKRYVNDILPKVRKMLKDANVKNGMVFMQCKVEDGVVIVYDLGLRLTGSLEYKIFDKLSNYNTLELMIGYALTGRMADYNLAEVVDPFKGYGFNISVVAEPGIIARIKGIEKIEALPEVAGVLISHLPGEEITKEMYGLLAQITVRVVGAANTYPDFVKVLNKIADSIKVIDINGKNMVTRFLTEDDYKNSLC